MEQDSRSSESYRTHQPSGLGYVCNKQLPQREGLSDAAACGPKADPRDATFLRTYSCWGVPFRDAGNAQSHWWLQQQSLSHAFVSNPNSLVGSRNLSQVRGLLIYLECHQRSLRSEQVFVHVSRRSHATGSVRVKDVSAPVPRSMVSVSSKGDLLNPRKVSNPLKQFFQAGHLYSICPGSPSQPREPQKENAVLSLPGLPS